MKALVLNWLGVLWLAGGAGRDDRGGDVAPVTPSERQRRIEAATDALCAREALPDRLVNRIHAKVALDAADEAVPMISEAEMQRRSRIDHRAAEREHERAERAEAAARDFADVLRELVIYLREPHAKIGEACGIDACVVCLAEGTARNALARHPSFSGEEGTEG